MSQVILAGFGWGLAIAISFVVLGYPTLLSFLLGIVGGWIWGTIALYWTSEDEPVDLPSYLDDIESLAEELEDIGTGGRIDLHKALRRRDAQALREKAQARYRSRDRRHRGKPTTLGDRIEALQKRLFPPKKKPFKVDSDGLPIFPENPTEDQLEAIANYMMNNREAIDERLQSGNADR